MKLTVFYEGKFWVGVIEEMAEGKLKVYRHIFGGEPKDPEIWQFVIHDMLPVMDALSRSTGVKGMKEAAGGRINPKRLARLTAREMDNRGISTFAQKALKQEYEQRKKEKASTGREERERQEALKRERKVLKAKQRHRGR
ncbi:YjdF family protein [Fontibacillus phaseoli]|nr:YjdF family protein [Fontibacillus phaseoli]